MAQKASWGTPSSTLTTSGAATTARKKSSSRSQPRSGGASANRISTPARVLSVTALMMASS